VDARHKAGHDEAPPGREPRQRLPIHLNAKPRPIRHAHDTPHVLNRLRQDRLTEAGTGAVDSKARLLAGKRFPATAQITVSSLLANPVARACDWR